MSVAETDSVSGLNADVLDELLESVEARAGAPLMLLTAPRAGYGKTHLLGRVVQSAGGDVVMVPLAFRSGDVLNLGTITRRGLEALSQAGGGSPVWSKLREACAGLVAHVLHDLIKDGQVPSANPEQALRVLSGAVADVFDKEGPAHMIGDWLRKHSAGLRPIMVRHVAKQVPLRSEKVDAWLEAMLAQAFEGGAEGVAVMQELAATDQETGTPAWLRLLALWRPVVLLVDHLDGYYRNPDAGVTIATLLIELVESQGLHVLLSLNQDVWQATFGHHLPSALEDRLTASQVLLRGLREADALSLLRLRLTRGKVTAEDSREFEAFLDVKQYFMGRPIGSVSARAFLRHCSRQWEVFQTSVPLGSEGETRNELSSLSPEADEPIAWGTDLEPAPETEVPVIFDDTVSAEMQQMAESLSEPPHALPQNTPAPSFTSGEISDTSPPPAEGDKPSAAASDWRSSVATASEKPTSGGVASIAPSTDAFVKLREMLHHLRQPGASPKLLDEMGDLPPERLNLPTKPVAVSAPVAGPPPPTPVPPSRPGDALLGRFEALRLQMSTEAESQPLDYQRLTELIRLAGRRFPLVRQSEHELPGLTGRQTLVWSIQGVELLFGLAPFSEIAYWRVLAGFAAGRQVDLSAEAERDGTVPVKLKLVTFKADRENDSWQSLSEGDTIPEPLKDHLDAVHLDVQSVSALYAMQRIIKDAETGAVQAEPTQVMTVLARELDFFWKRITKA